MLLVTPRYACDKIVNQRKCHVPIFFTLCILSTDLQRKSGSECSYVGYSCLVTVANLWLDRGHSGWRGSESGQLRGQETWLNFFVVDTWKTWNAQSWTASVNPSGCARISMGAEVDAQKHHLCLSLSARLSLTLFKNTHAHTFTLATDTLHRSLITSQVFSSFPHTTLTHPPPSRHHLCSGFSSFTPPPSLLSHAKHTRLHILTYF